MHVIYYELFVELLNGDTVEVPGNWEAAAQSLDVANGRRLIARIISVHLAA